MSIKISYKKGIVEKGIKNYVLFSDENFNVNGLKKLPLAKSSNEINKTIESNKSKKKDFISTKSINELKNYFALFQRCKPDIDFFKFRAKLKPII